MGEVLVGVLNPAQKQASEKKKEQQNEEKGSDIDTDENEK